MNRRFLAGLLAIFMSLAVSTAGMGQSKPLAPSPSDEALESSPVASDGSPASTVKSQVSPSNAFDVSRVVIALAAVIGLILILRMFAKRVIPGASAPRASSSVKILGRVPISTRQNLLVIQFGKRLVLVGDCGSGLNPLCEIADPDEVAAIAAQAQDETISVARRFESLFGRARKDFDESPEQQSSESFDDSRDVPPGDNPSLQDTQQEISDLRQKVRDVARQIGRA